MKEARYYDSLLESIYRRNIDRRVAGHSRRYDEQQRRAQQEQERIDRYSQRTSSGRRHRDRIHGLDREGDESDSTNWLRHYFFRAKYLTIICVVTLFFNTAVVNIICLFAFPVRFYMKHGNKVKCL